MPQEYRNKGIIGLIRENGDVHTENAVAEVERLAQLARERNIVFDMGYLQSAFDRVHKNAGGRGSHNRKGKEVGVTVTPSNAPVVAKPLLKLSTSRIHPTIVGSLSADLVSAQKEVRSLREEKEILRDKVREVRFMLEAILKLLQKR